MGYLYILSEGERDDLCYDLVAERATGRTFERPADFRLRHGANWKTALAGGRLLLNRVKHWNEPQDVAVILAVDNDRAPEHPRPLVGHDLKKAARYPAVAKMVTDALGTDRDARPVKVAVAIPVEMIESWVLLLCDSNRPKLPLFAEASQASARAYYGTQPPPQLKDLRNAEAEAAGKSLDEYFWYAAEQDLDAVTSVSQSFKMFIGELKQWHIA